jgi:hypothetical protein
MRQQRDLIDLTRRPGSKRVRRPVALLHLIINKQRATRKAVKSPVRLLGNSKPQRCCKLRLVLLAMSLVQRG